MTADNHIPPEALSGITVTIEDHEDQSVVPVPDRSRFVPGVLHAMKLIAVYGQSLASEAQKEVSRRESHPQFLQTLWQLAWDCRHQCPDIYFHDHADSADWRRLHESVQNLRSLLNQSLEELSQLDPEDSDADWTKTYRTLANDLSKACRDLHRALDAL